MNRSARTIGVLPLEHAAQLPRRILIVEDDRDLAELVARKLANEGFVTVTAGGVQEALRAVATRVPHLAVVDIRLPDGSGLDFCRQVQQTTDLPIILVTAVDDSAVIVDSLLQVAEDYIVKPFNLAELAARVHRVLRRLLHENPEPAETRLDDCVSVNFYTRSLACGERTVELTPIESKLLHVLMAHQGAIVPSGFLLQRVWPMQAAVDETLRVHMSRLRRKLELVSPATHYIETERSIGYRFVRTPAADSPAKADGALSRGRLSTDELATRKPLHTHHLATGSSAPTGSARRHA
jgi:DNA-binding response OmpR family regulator